MNVHARKRWLFPGGAVNFYDGRFSVSLRVGPYTYNTKQRTHRVNLPGPFFWRRKR